MLDCRRGRRAGELIQDGKHVGQSEQSLLQAGRRGRPLQHSREGRQAQQGCAPRKPTATQLKASKLASLLLARLSFLKEGR